MSIAVAIAAVAAVLFFVVLYVALGRLTGDRHRTAVRYVALGLLTGLVVLDWLSGATERVMIEGWVLVVLIPVGIAYLTILVGQESR